MISEMKFISDLISGRYKKLPPLQTVSGNDMDFEKFSGYLGLIDETALNTLIDILDADTDIGANPEPGTERKGYLGVPRMAADWMTRPVLPCCIIWVF